LSTTSFTGQPEESSSDDDESSDEQSEDDSDTLGDEVASDSEEDTEAVETPKASCERIVWQTSLRY
jgi:hypothetical protein